MVFGGAVAFWPRKTATGLTKKHQSSLGERVLVDSLDMGVPGTGKGCVDEVDFGVAGARSDYVTKRRSWSAVSARIPNMQWHITFMVPRTRT